MQEHDIPPIDMVVVNLYPFAQTVAKPGCTMEDAIENIDIGGPGDGARRGQEPRVRRGRDGSRRLRVAYAEDEGHRRRARLRTSAIALAAKAFSHTAEYDGMISNWLTARDASGAARAFPDRLNLQLRLAQTLRYGENPHQSAAFYVERKPPAGTLAGFTPAAGQGAFLQQHRRCRRGVGVLPQLRRAAPA